jgi:hypothetical protein
MRKQSKVCCGKEMEPYWLMSSLRHRPLGENPDGPKDIPIYRCSGCGREIERFDEL